MVLGMLSCHFIADADGQLDKKAEFIELIQQHSHKLIHANGQYSGSAWDFLLQEGQAAQFFLLGEEHGIAENPKMTAALFTELNNHGYLHFGIEVSPQLAALLQDMAAIGLPALQAMFKNPDTYAAFFGMYEEADMLVQIMREVENKGQVLWGLDYEVLGDNHVIKQLANRTMPAPAKSAFDLLYQHSVDARNKYQKSKNPGDLFSFSADPAWVKAVMDAWPNRDDSTTDMLHTLYETYAINQHWTSGDGWASNNRRAQLLRHNFFRYWQQHQFSANKPKVFFKLGSSHMMRGRNSTEVYDLGNLLPELAAAEGSQSFQLLVLPGKGSPTAVLNPSTMKYAANTPKDGYTRGLDLLMNLAADETFTLLDLRPLRSMTKSKYEFITTEMMQIIHGYDALLVMSGSTASKNLID